MLGTLAEIGIRRVCVKHIRPLIGIFPSIWANRSASKRVIRAIGCKINTIFVDLLPRLFQTHRVLVGRQPGVSLGVAVAQKGGRSPPKVRIFRLIFALDDAGRSVCLVRMALRANTPTHTRISGKLFGGKTFEKFCTQSS